jgi:hypothetical protein
MTELTCGDITYVVFVYLSSVATQQLGKHVTAAMNTHATIEELLDAMFSIPPAPIKYWVFSERKIGDRGWGPVPPP